MGKLKITPNLFLETHELNRFREFLCDKGYKQIMRYLTQSFGIAKNEDNTFFKVSKKSSTLNNVFIVNAGIGFNPDFNIITLHEDAEVTIGYANGSKYYLTVKYATTNEEEGTVKISKDGALVGENTKFLSVLRGQPNFPTKIRFTNAQYATGDYEVVEVNSDSDAMISGEFAEAETDLKYCVIGTFTPGFQPDPDNALIYEHDDCIITLKESADVPTLEEGEYLLACIEYENDIPTITDMRSDYLFNDVVEKQTTLYEDPFVSLTKTKIRNERLLDIMFEWGYNVNRYEISNTATSNIFTIVSGSSNFINSVIIPDGMFRGWRLLNRSNMISVLIDNNIGAALYISKFNSRLISSENDDFIIIPDFKSIEVKTTLSGEQYEDEPSFFNHFDISGLASHIVVPVEYGKTGVEVKYRLITKDDESTKFLDFSNVQFVNIKGEKETLGQSSFNISLQEPIVSTRNYS